jgi:hypothetical protein
MKLTRTISLSVGLLCLTLSLAAAQVVNPRITTDSSIDTSSAAAVVKQITNDKMTDEQKAVACWKFMLEHYYHWTPAVEPDVPSQVRDFAKAINSYGYGPCFQNAPVISALWEACGFPTRNWTIGGHTIPEVKYGGKWHMIDADGRGYSKKADGGIASVRELAKDMKLFTAPPGGKSKPYYPFGAPDKAVKPFVFWGPASKIMDLYASKKNNHQFNRRAVMAHPMYITLRPGETLTRNYANVGKFYMPPKAKPDHEFYKGGPREVTGKYTYGNGTLTWKPDLKTIKPEQLFWAGSTNVKLDGGKIVPVKPGASAHAIFRVLSPYALVDATVLLGTTDHAPKGHEISFDGGFAWSPVTIPAWKGTGDMVGVANLTKFVTGRYEYFLKVPVAGALTSISFRNTFQHSQLAMPRLKPGKNKVKIFSGPAEGHVQLVRAKGKPRKDRYIFKSEGLDPRSVRPAKRDCSKAYVIYKLTAPAPLTAVSMGANMTMDPGKPAQYINAFVSIDDGKTWTEAWKRPNHRNWGNSQFELDKRLEFKNEAGSKQALFKFEMARSGKYFSVNSLRLYAFYKQPQSPGAKLKVDLAWEEKTDDKWTPAGKRSLIIAKFPHEFEIECKGAAARFSKIMMTPEK